MKVLFLANLSDQLTGFHKINDLADGLSVSAFKLGYPINLLKKLAKFADVWLFSPEPSFSVPSALENSDYKEEFGVTLIHHETSIPKTVNVDVLLRNFDFDVLLVYVESIFPYLRNLEKAPCKKVMWFLSAPQDAVIPSTYEYFKANKPDLLIKVVDKANRTYFSQSLKHLNIPMEWLPFSVDTLRFKYEPTPKIYDLTMMGNLNPVVYPLRVRLSTVLQKQRSFSYSISEAYGEEYVKKINQSKIFITTGGAYHFPVLKYFEAMACRCLLVADNPLDMEELGFNPGENFVSLSGVWYPNGNNLYASYPTNPSEYIFNPQQFMAKMAYYLTHEAERENIAKRGERLIQTYHSDEVRAKQLYDLLLHM